MHRYRCMDTDTQIHNTYTHTHTYDYTRHTHDTHDIHFFSFIDYQCFEWHFTQISLKITTLIFPFNNWMLLHRVHSKTTGMCMFVNVCLCVDLSIYFPDSKFTFVVFVCACMGRFPSDFSVRLIFSEPIKKDTSK